MKIKASSGIVYYKEGVKSPRSSEPLGDTFKRPFLSELAALADETVMLRYGIIASTYYLPDLVVWLKENLLGQSVYSVLGGYEVSGYTVRVWFELQEDAVLFMLKFV